MVPLDSRESDCLENNLVIELDGSSHLISGHKERDARKNKFFKDQGIKVIRFDISKKFDPQKILRIIKNEILNNKTLETQYY